MKKTLKDYVRHDVPLMESRYCNTDDYSFLIECLKYKFIKKGHYAVRQGEHASRVYFIIQGSADVKMYGPTEEQYLDKKSMYNEISVKRA